MIGCLKQARSEDGSLRDEIPQAGLGGSPTFSQRSRPLPAKRALFFCGDLWHNIKKCIYSQEVRAMKGIILAQSAACPPAWR